MYSLAKQKRSKVCENYKVINGARLWDWTWLRAPNSNLENGEMEDLNKFLQSKMCLKWGIYRAGKTKKDGGFSIRGVRKQLADRFDLNNIPDDFIWNRWATLKCNMFVCHAVDGKIPTAVSLRRRGINTSMVCRMCDQDEETTDHVSVTCRFADTIWRNVFIWIQAAIVGSIGTVKQLMYQVNHLPWSRNKKKMAHALCLLTLWSIW
ncbi:putative reverse transcriptase zinc-binding domain-containing protein [Helianthus debilis subsp. tardiflorus]